MSPTAADSLSPFPERWKIFGLYEPSKDALSNKIWDILQERLKYHNNQNWPKWIGPRLIIWSELMILAKEALGENSDK